MADLQPASLRAEPDALGVLMYSFDFELLPRPKPPARFAVKDRESAVEACDATGGEYASCQGPHDTQARWIYVGNEGRAGVVAASFAQLIALIVSLPYWHDVLKYSARGNLDEMRRAAKQLERDALDDLPDLPAARAHLLESLNVSEPADPVTALHEHAVTSKPDMPIMATEGWRFDTLVGTLRLADARP